MSKIATYSLADTPLQLSDRLIGTEAPRPIPSATPLATKNFSLAELLTLFSSNFPGVSLQAVLDTGNTAIQDIGDVYFQIFPLSRDSSRYLTLQNGNNYIARKIIVINNIVNQIN